VKLKPLLQLSVALTLTVLTFSAAQAFDKPGYPRLGGYLIGGPQNYDDPNYQAAIARLNVVVLSTWPGQTFNDPNQSTLAQVLQSMKSRNGNLQTLLYVNINEAQLSDAAAGTVANNGWWLYPNGTSGGPVKSTWGNDFYIINTSIWNTGYLDWKANQLAQLYWYPNSGALDGFYVDNLFTGPRVDGDWNRDGSTDSRGWANIIAGFRQGNQYYFGKQRSYMPGKWITGNIGFRPGESQPEYEYQLNGGVIEGVIGYGYSPDSWGTFNDVMSLYHETMNKALDPKLVIFHQNGPGNDWQAFRYGFTTCLLDDGYYYYSLNDSYHGVNWFDEFNANLGYATSSPTTSSWQSGVYRRDFQNGIVLVNPKGNGARQVFLEDDYVKLSGSQDPNVNNGQTVRSVVLQDRDGIVLMRKSASTAPAVSQPASPAPAPAPAPASSSSSSVASVASSSTSSVASSSSSSAASRASSSSSAAIPAGARQPAPPSGVNVR
jgi:hypothetical protein